MFPRDWILETLAGLELWYWPIFFWEMLRIERYCTRRRAAGKIEMIGIGVTRKGRIHIISRMAGDQPDPADWTQFAPRMPWAKLDLGELADTFAPALQPGLDMYLVPAVSAPVPTVRSAVFLDPG